jgi:hypothetical protein
LSLSVEEAVDVVAATPTKRRPLSQPIPLSLSLSHERGVLSTAQHDTICNVAVKYQLKF